jgi:hypothetical protein
MMKLDWQKDQEIERKARAHQAAMRKRAGLPALNQRANVDPRKNRPTVIGAG